MTHSHLQKLALIAQLPQATVEPQRLLPQAQLLAAKAATNPTCKTLQLPGTIGDSEVIHKTTQHRIQLSDHSLKIHRTVAAGDLAYLGLQRRDLLRLNRSPLQSDRHTKELYAIAGVDSVRLVFVDRQLQIKTPLSITPLSSIIRIKFRMLPSVTRRRIDARIKPWSKRSKHFDKSISTT